jgi:hypothetical protein
VRLQWEQRGGQRPWRHILAPSQTTAPGVRSEVTQARPCAMGLPSISEVISEDCTNCQCCWLVWGPICLQRQIMEQFSKISRPFACVIVLALLLGRSPLRSSLGQSGLGFASRPKRLAVRPSQRAANVSNRGHSEVVVQSSRVFRLFAGSTGLTRKLSS